MHTHTHLIRYELPALAEASLKLPTYRGVFGKDWGVFVFVCAGGCECVCVGGCISSCVYVRARACVYVSVSVRLCVCISVCAWCLSF